MSRSTDVYRAKMKRIEADRKLIAERFPFAFVPPGSPHAKRPLKVGIHADLHHAGLADANGVVLSRRRIWLALQDYCRGPKYALALRRGGTRFDLNGEASGAVAEDAHKDAIRNWHARYAHRKFTGAFGHQVAEYTRSVRTVNLVLTEFAA